MSEWLWRDKASGVGLRPLDNDDERVALSIGEGAQARLDIGAALALADALRGWAQPGARPTSGTWFEVYYRHEYTDDDGNLVPIPALGSPDDGDAFTWDESDVAAVRQRVRRIGQALAELHEAETGERSGPYVDEAARAWVSVFRMPDDVRVWKGFWDELDDVPDDELLRG